MKEREQGLLGKHLLNRGYNVVQDRVISEILMDLADVEGLIGNKITSNFLTRESIDLADSQRIDNSGLAETIKIKGITSIESVHIERIIREFYDSMGFELRSREYHREDPSVEFIYNLKEKDFILSITEAGGKNENERDYIIMSFTEQK